MIKSSLGTSQQCQKCSVYDTTDGCEVKRADHETILENKGESRTTVLKTERTTSSSSTDRQSTRLESSPAQSSRPGTAPPLDEIRNVEEPEGARARCGRRWVVRRRQRNTNGVHRPGRRKKNERAPLQKVRGHHRHVMGRSAGRQSSAVSGGAGEGFSRSVERSVVLPSAIGCS